MSTSPGTLYLVATPIGNLGDMTERAVATCARVSQIVAEDTRRSRGLLSHFGVTGKELSALDANASERAVARVVALLERGPRRGVRDRRRDAGRERSGAGAGERGRRGRGVPITVVAGRERRHDGRGAVGAGRQGRSCFWDFCRARAAGAKSCSRASSTRRCRSCCSRRPIACKQSLLDLAARCPEREAAVCRELTKMHEEVLRGSLQTLAQVEREWLGEIVIVLGEAAPLPAAGSSDDDLRERARGLVSGGASVRAVADHLAEISGRSRREVYALVLEVKGTLGDAD